MLNAKYRLVCSKFNTSPLLVLVTGQSHFTSLNIMYFPISCSWLDREFGGLWGPRQSERFSTLAEPFSGQNILPNFVLVVGRRGLLLSLRPQRVHRRPGPAVRLCHVPVQIPTLGGRLLTVMALNTITDF